MKISSNFLRIKISMYFIKGKNLVHIKFTNKILQKKFFITMLYILIYTCIYIYKTMTIQIHTVQIIFTICTKIQQIDLHISQQNSIPVKTTHLHETVCHCHAIFIYKHLCLHITYGITVVILIIKIALII